MNATITYTLSEDNELQVGLGRRRMCWLCLWLLCISEKHHCVVCKALSLYWVVYTL